MFPETRWDRWCYRDDESWHNWPEPIRVSFWRRPVLMTWKHAAALRRADRR